MKAKSTLADLMHEHSRLNSSIQQVMESSVSRIQAELEEMAQTDQNTQVKKIVDSYIGEESSELAEKELQETSSLSKPFVNRHMLTAEKIVEFIEQAIEDQKNGLIDDDANATEMSSLTNQFKVITQGLGKNIKSKLDVFSGLGKLFNKEADHKQELRQFVCKILDGDIVRDQQIEYLCNQLENEENRAVIVEVLNNVLKDNSIELSFNGLQILEKLFFMKSAPKRDWVNISNLVICVQNIEKKRNLLQNKQYTSLKQGFGGHFIFQVEEFWVGCIDHLVSCYM